MLVYKIEKVDSVLNKSSNCNTTFLNLLHCSVLSGWSLVFFYSFFPFISPKNGLARRWGAFYKDALWDSLQAWKELNQRVRLKLTAMNHIFQRWQLTRWKRARHLNVLNLNREYVSSKIFKFSMSWINNNNCCFVATHKMGAMKWPPCPPNAALGPPLLVTSSVDGIWRFLLIASSPFNYLCYLPSWSELVKVEGKQTCFNSGCKLAQR